MAFLLESLFEAKRNFAHLTENIFSSRCVLQHHLPFVYTGKRELRFARSADESKTFRNWPTVFLVFTRRDNVVILFSKHNTPISSRSRSLLMFSICSPLKLIFDTNPAAFAPRLLCSWNMIKCMMKFIGILSHPKKNAFIITFFRTL